MDLLLILTYAAFCIAIFKVFRIPLTKWTVPTAVLGGIVLIGTLIFVMNYNHPFSEMSRQYFVTIPIVPEVKGKVIEVNVKSHQHLKKDDVIFRIDPDPFLNQVKALKARLVAAKDDLNRAQELVRKRVGRQRDVDQTQAAVDDLKAQMQVAEYDLDNTVYRAPADGYVAQFSLRPGARAVNLPFRPAGIFVPTERQYFVGWFRQNSTQRLVKGADAEVLFDGVPGEVFTAVVEDVLPTLAEGQVQPNGTLIDQTTAQTAGRVPVRLRITDPRLDQYLIPGGAYGQAAIYTEHFSHVAVMRKVLVRMTSWMNYLFPFH
ncbi:MAG: biotin/lipoyl-binding protein [Motiliproteus sp.]